MKMFTRRNFATAVAALMLSLLAAAPASAIPTTLGLVGGTPDIAAFFGQTTYTNNGSTGLLTLSLFATTLDLDGNPPPDYSIPAFPTETILINFDTTVNPGSVLGGSLVINGTVGAPLNFAGPTLLTGSLSLNQFAARNVGGSTIFEMIFDVTGGDAAGLYGNKIGVIANAGQIPGVDLTFQSAFQGDGFSALADNFGMPVPEPVTGATALMGVAGLGLAAMRRRRA